MNKTIASIPHANSFHDDTPDAPPMKVYGEGAGHPKNTQKSYDPHPSTTTGQRADGGRGHGVLSGVAPVQPVQAYRDGAGKPTHRPECHRSMVMKSPAYDKPASHEPELADAILDEAIRSGSATMPGERHHSVTGPKGAYKPRGPGIPQRRQPINAWSDHD